MSDTAAFRHDLNVPAVLQAFIAAEGAVAAADIDKHLFHLVKLRASQINQCAFCVKMHTKEARQDGETNDRLDRLVVWRHVSDFTPREKAAFAWTEALTELSPKTDFAPLRAELRAHFTDVEASALTAAVGMINLWNRLQVSGH
ncbi:carboxymuconolactone decarboxylase family protein [Caulobacter sp. LARHSG274]